PHPVRCHAGDELEVPEKPPEEIDRVDPLVQELTPPGQRRIHAPLALVPGTAAVSVPTPKEKERTDPSSGRQLLGSLHGRMIPVVEANLYYASTLPSCRHHLLRLVTVPAHWLLAEHMLTGPDRRFANCRQPVVGRRDHDRIHGGMADHLPPVRHRGGAGALSDVLRAGPVTVGGDHDTTVR